MKIEYDPNSNAAYISLKTILPGEVFETKQLNEFVYLDIDSQGKTIGIEILNAEKNLPGPILKESNSLS
jgi:uncharacterized protein YuzE